MLMPATPRPKRSLNDTAEGVRLKEEALKLLESHRARYILLARRAFLEILIVEGTATIDAVRDAIVLPPHINPKCFGPVPISFAKNGVIQRVGDRPTRHHKGHARRITIWGLVDLKAALRWLIDNPDPDEAEDATDRPRPEDDEPILF